ncbi:divalent-cation tolerance protein CutA [Acaryochloris marina]|uniref:Divalent cation tolerance protein CutA, putative n=1 Tax=Acaryochloris marina (strain MBIC 11017) TaxID=329726 RepID=B0C2K2_ACAM1|nr:divalent-cation tolerance protein CutA [Acaryochloris marina]ABW29792.1 divalent cation tolerance protein CutA, putative [Acaryochloris marina MBIC11017]BDM78678.1 divalent-cation tolerance protein CutA [Acaryochloris marina MBIC10699]
METDAIVVMVTASSEDEAVAIAALLVRDHLAACVSLFPVSSIYTWDNKVQNEPEWQLMIKTQQDKFADLETKVRELHTYDVPEIIALPVTAGSMPYLNWISTQVQS